MRWALSAFVSPLPRNLSSAHPPLLIDHKSAMARSKLPPRKLIMKPNARDSTRTVRLPPTSASAPLPLPTYRAPDGVTGETLLLGAEPKTARVHFVFLPGNPGVICFYKHALERVLARCPADVRNALALHALGLPGHDSRALNGCATYGTKEHAEYLGSYLSSLSPGRVVLCGHSYGAWLALKVLGNSVGAERMPAALLLMPCVRRMAECAGTFTCLALNDPFGAVSTATWAIGRALHWSGRLGFATHIAQSAEHVVASAPSTLYQNIGSLARDEMRDITEVPARAPCMQAPTHVLWADDDKWCPPETVRAITKSHGENVIVEKLPGVKHAFVLDANDTEKVAGTVASWIVPLVREVTSRDAE